MGCWYLCEARWAQPLPRAARPTLMMRRMQAGSARSLSAEMPEGNGTGFVWDDQVTDIHRL